MPPVALDLTDAEVAAVVLAYINNPLDQDLAAAQAYRIRVQARLDVAHGRVLAPVAEGKNPPASTSAACVSGLGEIDETA